MPNARGITTMAGPGRTIMAIRYYEHGKANDCHEQALQFFERRIIHGDSLLYFTLK